MAPAFHNIRKFARISPVKILILLMRFIRITRSIRRIDPFLPSFRQKPESRDFTGCRTKFNTTTFVYLVAGLIWVLWIPIAAPRAEDLGNHKDNDAAVSPLEEGFQVFWYERAAKKTAWMSADEIAVFPKRGFAGRIDPNVLSAKYHETAYISESNDFVTFLKSKKPLDNNGIKKKMASIKEIPEIEGVSPVFYTSDAKNAATRMALTGKIIVRYPENFTEEEILGIENEFALGPKSKIHFQKNTFSYQMKDALRSLEAANAMQLSGNVIYAFPDWLRGRAKRSLPDDPLFPDQWHLNNTGQGGGIPGEDVNIVSVWQNYRGSGTTIIAIVDDGMEISHEDLRDNIIPGLSWDYTGNDPDPTAGDHGTSCSGVAAGKGFNGIGITGAAPDAGLVGYRLLDSLTDANEADALTRNNGVVDIYSNSWGPYDDGRRLEGPGPLTQDAIEIGVSSGRDGLGSIFVWAGGNGGDVDNSNYDGYANSRYTIAVGASTNFGDRSYYSETGANILVNAPSDGGSLDITTTDRTGLLGYDSGNYTDSFGGTSSATPLVSGIIALILEANPDLSWRDVQHLLISTAEQNNPEDSDWKTNGAGYPVNHKYGYGRIDANSATASAQFWISAGAETYVEAESAPNMAIPDNNTTGVTDTITISADIRIEFVEVIFTAGDHNNWGDLEIVLTSPDGTPSILAQKHKLSRTNTRYDHWKFGTARHYGELSAGEWSLLVQDLVSKNKGTFQSWTLIIYGTPSEETADLSIIASDNADPVYVGESLVYTFNIANYGPSEAANVVLKDCLPELIRQAEYSIDHGAEWNSWPGSLNIGAVASGETKEVLIRGRVDVSAAGSFVNTAKAIAFTHDPNLQNNSVTESTVIKSKADLSINTTDDPDPAFAGSVLSYRVTVENAGPSDAVNVVMSHILPDALQNPVFSLNDGVDWSAWSGSISLGSIPPLTSRQILLRGQIDPSFTGETLYGSAWVASDTFDPDDTGNRMEQSTAVIASADLALSKTASQETVTAGETITYTVDVSNAGPSTADNVVVRDVLPDPAAFQSVAGDGWQCGVENKTITCTRTRLDPMQSAGFAVTVVAPPDEAVLTNTAAASSRTPDPDSKNNSAEAVVAVTPRADLALTKTDSADPVTAGQTLTYTLTLKNNGPSLARGIRLTDVLPAVLLDPHYSTDGGNVWSAWTGTVDPADLPAGASFQVLIRGNVDAAFTGSIVNDAHAAAVTPDVLQDNNAARQSTAVIASADMAMMQNILPATVIAGQPIAYTFVIKNTGPSDAVDLEFTDILPEDALFVGTNGDDWVFSLDGRILKGQKNILDVNAETCITLTVNSPDSEKELFNSAKIFSTVNDPDMTNNEAASTVLSVKYSDIAIDKTVNNPSPFVGQTIVYTLTALNNGPHDSFDIRIEDEFPDELIFIEDDSDGQYDPENHIWALAQLPAGHSAVLHISGKVIQSGIIINTARKISSAFSDPYPENNFKSSQINGVAPKGDVNGDGFINLKDAIYAIQISIAMRPQNSAVMECDVNGNGKIDTAEALYALQFAAGIRNAEENLKINSE